MLLRFKNYFFFYFVIIIFCYICEMQVVTMKKLDNLQLFNKLFNDYRVGFIRFANSYVKDSQIAEDIVNEAFMVYWNNKDNLAPESNIPSYILTVIKNKSINHLKEAHRRNELFGELNEHSEWKLNTQIATLEAFEPNDIFSEEIKKIIDNTLETLPKKTLEVFLMSRYQDKSHKEIAELIGISTKGVEFHISKSLKILRNKLKDYLPIIVFLIFF